MTAIDRIDAANIGLMLLACMAAFLLPFELFLFSYAVLGPLHYLTEIGWLHKKNYFTRGKYDFVYLLVFAFLITGAALGLMPSLGNATHFIFTAFICGAIFIWVRDNGLKMMLVLILLISSQFIGRISQYEVLFAIYLPTIVHVFVFTGLFILYGALKNKSKWGVASLMVFALTATSFFWLPAGYYMLTSMDYIQSSYYNFAELNRNLINLLGLAELPGDFRMHFDAIYQSPAGIAVMRFVAFAYTYHYLNWFSKTSVIQWHKVPRNVLGLVVLVWMASVAIYAYDYTLGLKWLFFLSFTHVLLEFPLNFQSMAGIGRELKALVTKTI